MIEEDDLDFTIIVRVDDPTAYSDSVLPDLGAILAFTPAGISIKIPALAIPDPPAGTHVPSEA